MWKRNDRGDEWSWSKESLSREEMEGRVGVMECITKKQRHKKMEERERIVVWDGMRKDRGEKMRTGREGGTEVNRKKCLKVEDVADSRMRNGGAEANEEEM